MFIISNNKYIELNLTLKNYSWKSFGIYKCLTTFAHAIILV